MRPAHGWAAAVVTALILAANPAFAAPKRVVSTFLCTDEYVFRLLPRERIAALSFEATDRHPVVSTIADAAQGIPTIRPSSEAVLAFAPDLVVMYEGTMPILHAQLSHAGVAVLDVPWGNSLADVRRITTMLGRRLGAPQRARALLAEMDRKIPHVAGPRVRTLIYEPNGYASSGGITAEIMNLSGLDDAAPELRPTRTETLPVETVIARAPELLILSGDANARNSRADMVQHHPALAAFHGTMAWAKLTPLLCPGPWSMDAAATFTALRAKTQSPSPPRSGGEGRVRGW
jgi:iron complex transport system substrate-binding protein